jgi:hypothetical protein
MNADFAVESHGSIFLLQPLTRKHRRGLTSSSPKTRSTSEAQSRSSTAT